MVATNQIKKLRESNFFLGDQPFSLPFELFRNIAKTPRSSVPVLSASFLKPVLQNPGFPRVFRIFGQLLWLSCTSMRVHARACLHMLPKQINSSSALPWPLVSRLVSRQSRLRTLVFPRKTGGFAVEGVGFKLGM